MNYLLILSVSEFDTMSLSPGQSSMSGDESDSHMSVDSASFQAFDYQVNYSYMLFVSLFNTIQFVIRVNYLRRPKKEIP